ncbi:MAG TPA: ATP-binding protein [Rhizomicrobium sp.]|nr:ATP-binding protein [Rhizomicrobium sp.]
MAPPIPVLVATASPDLKARLLYEAIARRGDMATAESRILATDEIQAALARIPADAPAALIVVGRDGLSEDVAAPWLAQRRNLVVLGVDIVRDLILVALRDPGMESLLAALRDLVARAGRAPAERFSLHRLSVAEQPLLSASIAWAHALLRKACARLIDARPDQPGATVTTAAISDLLDPRPALTPLVESADEEDALDEALRSASDEPLAALAAKLSLSALEFRMIVLALAPELDPRHQRWIGLLMDDLTRRTGTLALYAELLGEPSQVRRQLASTGNLARWRVFEGVMPAADEPLRLDPALKSFLLGDASDGDAKLRRVLRPRPWEGAELLEAERARALSIVERAQAGRVALTGAHPQAWRAMVELGADALGTAPLRVELGAFQGWEPSEVEDAAVKLTRLGVVTGRPLVADATALEGEALARIFFDAAGDLILLASDPAHAVKLMGAQPFGFEAPLDEAGLRLKALGAAAAGAGVALDDEAVAEIASLFPLGVDGFEHAMRLARLRGAPSRERFLAACKDVSAQASSRLAERIEPEFTLDDVVLPADRKAQLCEVVDNVRLAAKVLDGWDFRRKLPYGIGVSALFHGPSGTGKTMAALAIAKTLGVQVLRIDLSRVVSKYIGDTEKNIDRVFHDAQISGAALLIDEADALMGKRSEVNDAHDRYANIEVAYLLQRMEAYEGLAILTTNLRQNLDAAFLRRLRFIVEFPRPDAAAREEIWRKCLPEGSHALDDAALRQLARKIELTGGHVRQITLRAAFLAAAEDSRIGLAHVAHAARAEYAKLGLPPAAIDLPEKRRAA